MKKNRKKIFRCLALVLLVSLCIQGSNPTSLRGPGVYASMATGAQTIRQSVTSDVTVHKLSYTNEAERPDIANSGEELDISTYLVSPYDKSQYGDVAFTLYRLKDNQATQAELADAVRRDALLVQIEKDGAASPHVESVVQKDIVVDEIGCAHFHNLVNGEYAVIETIHSKLIARKAEPIHLSLPVTNATGTGYLEHVHLYPKNRVMDISIIIKKLAVSNEGVETPLAGARFDLYRGEKGSGVKLNSDPIVCGPNGDITVKSLGIGKYYFVELEAPDLVDGMVLVVDIEDGARPGVGVYLVSRYALDNDENDLGFEIKADGTLVADDSLQMSTGSEGAYQGSVRNYERPEIDKRQPGAHVEGSSESVSYDVETTIPFEIIVDVPVNIEDYTQFDIEDVLTVDGIVDEINVLKSPIASVVADNGRDLVEGTDYTVFNNTVTRIEFSENGIALLKGAERLTISYSAVITATITPDADLVNTVTLTYNNGTTVRYDRDEEPFTTHGRTFCKVDGVAGGAPLEGAAFVLRNARGEYFNGFDGDTDTAVWVEQADAAAHYAAGKGILTSDEHGELAVTGLAAGDYTLIEVQAPEGFELPANPETVFSVGPGTYSASAQEIINTKKPDPPPTEPTTPSTDPPPTEPSTPPTDPPPHVPQTGETSGLRFTALLFAIAVPLFIVRKRTTKAYEQKR